MIPRERKYAPLFYTQRPPRDAFLNPPKEHVCCICTTSLTEPRNLRCKIINATDNGYCYTGNVQALCRHTTLCNTVGPNLDQNETYSPITQHALHRHLDNVIVIGPKRDVLCRLGLEADASWVGIDDDALLSLWLQRSKSVRDESIDDNRWQASHALPIDELRLHQFDANKFVCSLDNFHLPRYSDSLDLVNMHGQCWDMLQSYGLRGNMERITLASFYQQIDGLAQDGQVMLHTHGCQDRLLSDMMAKKNAEENDDLIEIPEVAKQFLQAYEDSCESGKIDIKSRNAFWELLDAHQYHSLDDFPTQEAISREAQRPQYAVEAPGKVRSGICQSPFANLPVEVIQKIALLSCSVDTTLSLASTCQSLRLMLHPMIDKVALEEMKLAYPFYLPLTPSEKQVWKDRMQIANESGDVETKNMFPWQAYLRECLLSSSLAMMNRRRVWSLVEDLSSKLI